jgi:hypothetical protein
MQHRTIRFKVLYLGEQGEWGREWCTITVHGNGDRTIRALCEIDDKEILRDATYTVDRDFAPKDCFVRLTIKDRFVGSTWFRFDGAHGEAEGYTAAEGRSSQRVGFPSPPVSMVVHPVSVDLWHWARIELDESRGMQLCAPLATCSFSPYGDTGPILGPYTMRAKFLGRERVKVRAGTFDCLRATYLKADGTPSLETWCTDDGDRLIVKMDWRPFASQFELVELERS